MVAARYACGVKGAGVVYLKIDAILASGGLQQELLGEMAAGEVTGAHFA